MWFANLSAHSQKLYGLVGLALVICLVLGRALGLVLFSSDAPERPDTWQESKVQPAEDTLAEFTTVSTQARWHHEGGANTQATAVSLANEPEGFKLLGVVNRAEKNYALVMSLDATSPRKVNQLAVGDILVGNWSIRDITATKVILVAEGAKPETRELMLYAPVNQPKAAADKGAKSSKAPKAKVERKSKAGGSEKSKTSEPKQPSEKSSNKGKPKTEAEIKARAERVKAAQERARAKKANEPKK